MLSSLGVCEEKYPALPSVDDPRWIADNAVITRLYDRKPQYFEISPDTGPLHKIAFQIQLVPPGILKANDNVSIEIILAMDTALADSRDHDFRIGVQWRSQEKFFTEAEGLLLTQLIYKITFKCG